MKIIKYLFNDHYKKSSDIFRKYFGFYWDFNNNIITSVSNPQKQVLFGHIMEYQPAELINEEIGLYKQKIKCLIRNTNENKQYLETLEEINPDAGDTIRLTIGQAIDQSFKKDSIIYKDYNFQTLKLNDLKSKTDEDYYASVDAEYNFFIKKYETKIASDFIPEEVLPNYYVVSLALNPSILSTISQEDFNGADTQTSNSPYIDFSKKFDKFITLDNNILFDTPNLGTTVEGFLFGLVLLAYCEQYAEIYDNVSVDYIATARTRFSNFLTNVPNKELMDHLNEFKTSYPMYCNINWATPTLSPLLTFLGNAGIALESFQKFIQDKVIIETQPTVQPNPTDSIFIFDPNFAGITEFKQLENKQNGSLITETTEFLFTHEISQWLSEFLDVLLNGEPALNNSGNIIFEVGETVTNLQGIDLPVANPGSFADVASTDRFGRSLPPDFERPIDNNLPNASPVPKPPNLLSIDLSHGIDLAQDLEETMNLENAINIMAAKPELQDLLLSNFRTYKQILDGELCKTDILFYRIEKSDSQNRVIQSFYVPNVSGVDILNYVDTQVKYNKEYRYKIFANTAVYGTEYYYKQEPLPGLAPSPQEVSFPEEELPQLADSPGEFEIIESPTPFPGVNIPPKPRNGDQGRRGSR